MGDMRVITMIERDVLHRVDSGSLRFTIKVPLPGLAPALTLLAKHNPTSELYQIIFARQMKVINMCGYNQEVTVFTVNNIDFGNQEFWVSWYNKVLMMGLWDEKKPFLIYTMATEHEIGYLRFNTISNNWAPVEWIIETPPSSLLRPLEYKEFDDTLSWLPMQNGKLPMGAMIGGFENGPIYIARANHNNSLCPGKYVPSTGMAYVPWGHREHAKRSFEILCGYNALWVKTQLNFIPTNAYVGGRSEVQNEPLYIGRAMHDGKLLTGKVHVRYKTCYLPYDGNEIEKSSYEILVIPQNKIKQALPFGHNLAA